MRIIVHAGFHKTGTTSLQDYLDHNRDRLAPWLRYYGKAEFPAASRLARRYGQRPFPWRMYAFRHRLRRFLAGLPDARIGGPALVLSRETFCGVMPGHRDWLGRPVRDYRSRAIPLARAIRGELLHRFGSDCAIEFLYTTRAREPWLGSVWGHLQRSIRLDQDLARFRAQFPTAMSPDSEARAIATALAPCPVHIVALESCGDAHEGPASAVLDLLDVPAQIRRTLPQARRLNVGQSHGQNDALLELNRSALPAPLLRRMKQSFLRNG